MKILFITENLNPDSGWGKYSADLTSTLRDKGVSVVIEEIPDPLKFKKHFFLGWWQASVLYFKYRDQSFDAIHCAVEPYGFITAIFSRLKRTKYIMTLHGTYSVLFLVHPIYKIFQQYVYKRADTLVAVSSYTKRRVSQLISGLNLVVIPNGVSYPSQKRLKKTNNHQVILGVGAVKNRKGYHLVIEALTKIKDDLGPFKYYIVGGISDIDYAEQLKKIISSNNLEDSVIITGRVSEEEKDKLYKQADLFVLTPISEGVYFEGFGLVYLEANSYGIPVIGTKDSGAESAVKDNYNGVLVDRDNPEELSAKIKELIQNDVLYDQMSANAINWVDSLRWNKIANLYKKLY